MKGVTNGKRFKRKWAVRPNTSRNYIERYERNIRITMNLYVHITEDEKHGKIKEI